MLKSPVLLECMALLMAAHVWVESRAQILAVQTQNRTGGNSSIPSDSTYGWRFQVGVSDLSVTHLGYWDHQGNGLHDAHPVGIWNSAGTLLGSATVPSGTAGTINTSYRFTPVTPFALAGNQTYYIGGYSPQPNDKVIAFSSEVFAPEISYHSSTYAGANGFNRPDISYGASHGIFGPNFIFLVVPEPPQYTVAAAAGLFLFGLARRFRQYR